jgi:type I site-specific restriction endonuclease
VEPEEFCSKNQPRALIQMATGSGKIFVAITFIYRLLKLNELLAA